MNWEQIKSMVNNYKLPNMNELTLSSRKTQEGKDEKGHGLDLYISELFNDDSGTIVEFRWAMCQTCREVKWKKFIAWNSLDNTTFERKI